MINYRSVKNTAKNNRLIRAEKREYILCISLIHGFYRKEKLARLIYGNDDLRVSQATFIRIQPSSKSWVLSRTKSINLAVLQMNIMKVMRASPKFWGNGDGSYVFLGTRKYRIYYDRLLFGKDKKIRLHKTIQYLYTPAFLALLFAEGYHKKNQNLSLEKLWFYNHAYDKEETTKYILNYLKDVCKLEASYDSKHQTIIFADIKQALKLADKTAKVINKKLKIGKYLTPQYKFKSFKEFFAEKDKYQRSQNDQTRNKRNDSENND